MAKLRGHLRSAPSALRAAHKLLVIYIHITHRIRRAYVRLRRAYVLYFAHCVQIDLRMCVIVCTVIEWKSQNGRIEWN